MLSDLGLASAAVSSLSLALMVIFDRLMVADCYRNMPRQAWLMSSLGGGTLGLAATLLLWSLLSASASHSMAGLAADAVALAYPYGLLMIVAGAVNIQVMCHYFRLFVRDKAEEVDETAIALWLSLAPFAIFAAAALLSLPSLAWLTGGGVGRVNVSWSYGLAVLAAIGALAAFELCDASPRARSTVRYAEIAKMLASIVIYTLLISVSLRSGQLTRAEALALQPYYWVGFLAGARVLVCRTDRAALWTNLRRLRKFLPVILVMEVIGMAVYLSEFVALGEIDPTLVNLVIGSHVMIVFILSLALSRLRRRMEGEGRRRIWLFGLRLQAHKLPCVDLTPSKLLRLVLAQGMILIALALA